MARAVFTHVGCSVQLLDSDLTTTMVLTFHGLERFATLKGIPIVPLVLATLLSGHGLRRRSLSADGAAAAFVVGFVMMGAGVWVFGVSLIVFYLVGSRATKCEWEVWLWCSSEYILIVIFYDRWERTKSGTRGWVS